MPRLKPIARDEADPAADVYYERDVQRYGHVLGSTELYAPNLPVMHAVKGLIAAYGETESLPLATKALVRTRVASLNGCPF